MVLKITNLHILRYLPTYWLYLLERYTIDNQRCTHTASVSKHPFRPSPAPRRPCPCLQAGSDAQRCANSREDGHQRLDDQFPNRFLVHVSFF